MREHGNIVIPPDVKANCEEMNFFLRRKGFRHHSYSIVYRPQDLGKHIIFDVAEKDNINEDIKHEMELKNFGYSFI